MTTAGNRRTQQDPGWHRTILLGSVLMLLGGFAVDVDAEGSLFGRFWPDAKLPVVCPTRRIFGVSCPACGLTRSVTHLIHGRPAQSFACHRLGALALLAIGLQIPYRGWRMTGRGARLDEWRVEEAALAGFCLLLLLNWLLP